MLAWPTNQQSALSARASSATLNGDVAVGVRDRRARACRDSDRYGVGRTTSTSEMDSEVGVRLEPDAGEPPCEIAAIPGRDRGAGLRRKLSTF